MFRRSGFNLTLLIVSAVLVAALSACTTDPGVGSASTAAAEARASGAAAVVEQTGTEGVTIVDPPVTLTDFTLTSQSGDPLSLSDLKGKMVLMSFGYTHCPDVCPLTLAHFKRVKQLLGDKGEDIQFVFISVDGKRDTPARLQEYLAMFDPAFIGLTGDETALRTVTKQYGADFVLENAGGLAEDYTVSHTAGGFLMDAEGNWMRKYAYDLDPKVVASDIESLIQTS